MNKKNISWREQGVDVCSKCDVKANYGVIFSDLLDEDIDCIHHYTSGVPADTAIYEQGFQDNYIYTIKSGIVAIIERDNNLKERVVELLTRGMTTGLESIDNKNYLQSAISLTPISLCKINLTKKDIDSCKKHTLAENISKKWQEKYNNQIKTSELTVGSTNERLIKLFKFMSLHTYIENENEFYMPTLKRISSIIGVSVENSSRSLSKMKDISICKVDKKRFKYID